MPNMVNPVVGWVSSEWSKNRKHPVTGVVISHAGIDIAAPVGTLVRAAFGGIIESIRIDSFPRDPHLWKGVKTGNHVLIRNIDKACQYYGHFDEVLVRTGEKIKAGQVIGTVGATGMATGPHLHFETWSSNKLSSHFDPRILFRRYQITPGNAIDASSNVKPTARAKSSKPTKRAKNYQSDFKDLAVDGDPGETTWKAAQLVMRTLGLYNGRIDGKAGPMTWKALQLWMRNAGHYSMSYLIDGWPGRVTIRGLQQFLAGNKIYNGDVDGEFGPLTVKAFQFYLNTQND